MCLGMRAARKVRLGRGGFSPHDYSTIRGRIGIAILAILLLGLNSHQSAAQTQGTSIVTDPAIWVAPASETPLPIRIVSSEPIRSQVMLLVRGLSATVKLSEGRSFGPGVWVVPVNALSRLRVQAPAEETRNDLSLSLVTLSGTVIAETKLTLFVAPLPAKTEQVQTAALPQQISEAEREFAVKLLQMGNDSIRAGNLAVAQQFYQRAADRGLPEAAMALAGTYDPRELRRLKITSVQPDRTKARTWYEKARKLGAPDADERLRSLP